MKVSLFQKLRGTSKPDHRRKEGELINERLVIYITRSDVEFLRDRANKECNSNSGVLRRCLRAYKADLEKGNE